MSNLKVTICVPVYEMENGERFLVEFLSHLMYQTYKNFDVVVSDQSELREYEYICDTFKNVLDVRYVSGGGCTCAAENVNNALSFARGDIIKLMYVDDFFVNTDALRAFVVYFDAYPDYNWAICGFTHCDVDKTKFYDTRQPWFGNKYVNGDNTTGNPSTYAVRRECVLEMDTNLRYIVDGEYFYRSYHYHGDPIIISDILVAFREHEASAFRDPALIALRDQEMKYCEEKYKKL